MSKKYLDKDGLTYFWSKTKQSISDSQKNLVDLYSNQTITGRKTFNSDTFYNGSVNATDITANKFIGDLTGDASTATKWSTARTLTLAGDYSGSVSIDGSSNVTLTGYNYGCYVQKEGSVKLPWNHIAHTEGAASYIDRSIILLITQPYRNGSSGIIKIDLYSNVQTSTAVGYKYADATVKWLVRDAALDVDLVKVGVMNVASAWSADVFIKSSDPWDGIIIKQLASGARHYGHIIRTWTLLDATEISTTSTNTSTNCYKTIESYKTYSDIYTSSDVGVVNKANSLTVTSIGSVTKPVYIDTNGVPTDCTYTLEKSVPSNAVFTDTWRDIQNNLTSTSTTDSLAAAQGKILNEKFSSYLPLTGGDLTEPLYLKYLPSSTGKVLDITGGTSSSSTTGALVVNGGVGISGTLNVGNIFTPQISFGTDSDLTTILLDPTSGLKISRQGSSITLTGSAVKIKATSAGAWATGTGTAAHITSEGELVKYSSSKRYKTNFNYDIDRNEYHNELMKFKPLEYSYKSSPNLTERGMIAEDVQEINNELVIVDDNTKLVESYKDRDITTMLIVEAQDKDIIIQDQQKQINDLTLKVNEILKLLKGE